METNNKTAPITPEKDRNAISLDLMHRMKLHGMASAFSESLSSTFAETIQSKGHSASLRNKGCFSREFKIGKVCLFYQFFLPLFPNF